jgi:hypothetical protein
MQLFDMRNLASQKEKPPLFRVVLSRYDLAMNLVAKMSRAGLEPATT